jgi:kynurenine--oxoglutarate transaminase/cysteine-S-conjugate beta-lyase/glutamine--phenylpyruvate transaminase
VPNGTDDQGGQRNPEVDPRSESLSVIDAKSEVLVTVGASHALSLAIAALSGPGDEVVLIEPAFDIYTGAVLTSGASPVYVPMKCRLGRETPARTSADFIIDPDELAAAFSEKTRLLVLNSPHNPTGKVFSREELHEIARVVDSHPHCIVISDEVYEHLTFNDDLPHIPFVSISPTLYDRTVTV